MATGKPVMLTTIDNPYNPFTRWDEWFQFDLQHGYGTCNYLARVVRDSEGLSDQLNDEEVIRAIDSIVDNDPLGLYVKVYKDTKVVPIKWPATV